MSLPNDASLLCITETLEKQLECAQAAQMRRMFVYIIRCNDASYYTGVTNDYECRFDEHQRGIDPTCYTFERRPLTLMYVEEFDNPLDAIAREKQLKGWSRAKKEALIRNDEPTLFKLSQNKTGIITVRHKRP